MKKIIAPFAALVLSAFLSVSLLHAQTVASWSAAGANCRAQVKLKMFPSVGASVQDDFVNKCTAAEQQCKANCIGNTSVYVSNFDGSQHPTRSCN